MSKETHKGKNYNIFDKHKYNELELQNAITVVTGIIPTPRKLDSLLLGY